MHGRNLWSGVINNVSTSLLWISQVCSKVTAFRYRYQFRLRDRVDSKLAITNPIFLWIPASRCLASRLLNSCAIASKACYVTLSCLYIQRTLGLVTAGRTVTQPIRRTGTAGHREDGCSRLRSQYQKQN